ncbi:chemotaxis protein [Anaerosporobacter faecicola]|uniref:chemotaxis protein n=1 Tax=Anaerosporobacter faecicola TaxID=2718714 RepID=UPI00143A28B5|nr:chemotaxis protein [Anaerosporobacter faecicola]
MVYKLGFIDDDDSLINDYKTRLKRKEIELVFVENCTTKKDVLKWILKNEIKCMLVDYKLTAAYDFNGTELVAFLNSELPDLPCIILTNYCDQGIGENLVIKNLFIEREKLDSDFESSTFEELVACFKQAVDVFNNRLKNNISEYEELKLKKDNGEISAHEEERLLEVFRILRAYNEVDDIPAELLTTNAAKKMSDILQSLDKLLDNTK